MAEATEKTEAVSDDLLARWRASPGVSLTVGEENAANLVAFARSNNVLAVPISSLASVLLTRGIERNRAQCDELKLTFSNFVVTLWGDRLALVVECLDKRSLLKVQEAPPSKLLFETEATLVREMLWVEVSQSP